MDEAVRNKRGFRIMSGSVLKLIALITMLADHTAKYILVKISFCITPFMVIFGETISVYSIMTTIGRLAFPIYCFLITEGYIHTHDRKKYGLNLLIFALISEIPWNLEHTGTLLCETQNVFFTLFLGYTALCIHEKYKDKLKYQLFGLLVIFAGAIALNADYGLNGVALILAIYLLREHKPAQALVGCCLVSSHIPAAVSFVFINMYNGERGFIKGKVFKYVFYLIYPAHILLIWFIRSRTVGY